MAERFTNKYLEIISRHIPSKTVRVRPNDKPWFNSEIRKQIRVRDRLHKISRQKGTIISLQRFKAQRNKVNNMVKHAREQFFLTADELVDTFHKNDPKSYWSLIKKLMKGTGSSFSIPPLVDTRTNILAYNDKEKADLLNRYFCSISSVNDNNREPPDVPLRTNATLSTINITEQDVKDILQILKIGKASGDDGISHQMLKATADTICKPLTKLFNFSLMKGKFPSNWKIARVMAVFKKDIKNNPSNYRPISLLSSVGKVMERVVFKYIFNYIIEHALLYAYQSGFIKGHSTVFQLLEIYHRVCQNLDDHLANIIIFCDISKAFDRVWHKGLKQKLKTYGISGELLNWIEDYITDRKQAVIINGERSELGSVSAGVPQGSVLGPMLFLLYINDITDNLSNLARLFADDTSLSYSGDDFITMESDINSDLQALDEWAKTWLVDFNPKKTQALVISNIPVPNMNIKFSNESVELVKNHKHLGVTLSSNGNWTEHIDNIVKSALKQVNVLRKLKFTLSKQALANIYLSFIRPVMEYACEVWDGCFEREVEKLEKVQLEAARIVTGLTRYANKDALYFETGWDSLQNRRENRKLTTFYKLHNRCCPDYLVTCLPPLVSDVNTYNLRNSEDYIPPRCRLRVSVNSFIPSSVRLWNNLDPSIRNLPTVSSFKNHIKTNVFKAPEYYREGPRTLNILHSRLRHQCSTLNADLKRINVINNPKCNCGSPYEDAFHYFLECPLYLNQRMTLVAGLNDRDLNIEILLFGSDDDDDQYNSFIFGKVRLYIKQTKRF